jgi:hypothetical protein
VVIITQEILASVKRRIIGAMVMLNIIAMSMDLKKLRGDFELLISVTGYPIVI